MTIHQHTCPLTRLCGLCTWLWMLHLTWENHLSHAQQKGHFPERSILKLGWEQTLLCTKQWASQKILIVSFLRTAAFYWVDTRSIAMGLGVCMDEITYLSFLFFFCTCTLPIAILNKHLGNRRTGRRENETAKLKADAYVHLVKQLNELPFHTETWLLKYKSKEVKNKTVTSLILPIEQAIGKCKPSKKSH